MKNRKVIKYVCVGIVLLLSVFLTGCSNDDNKGMPTGCYRATNRNGGLSDFELCISSDSVVYNYLEVDRTLESHEKTERLYPRWLSTSRTIQIVDNYDDYWFDCVFDVEDNNSMKCKGWGKGGFNLGSSSMWKKQ